MSTNWQKFTLGIHYNGRWLDKDSILSIELSELPLWEQENFLFMQQWVDTEEFIVVQTSGSTGRPKNIKIKKETMVKSARFTCDFLDIQADDKALLCLPVKYIGGKMMIVRSFVNQLKLTAIQAQSNVELVDNYNLAAMTPHQLSTTIKHNKDIPHHIETLILGGSATPSELIEKIKNWSTRVYSSYGMTETSSHIALKKLNGHNNNNESYFTIDPSIKLQTDDSECLLISAPYLGDDLIRTNDVVLILDDRSFEVLGRIDNVINTGGVKLHPEIIEQKLREYITSRFFIFGVSSQHFGERPVMIIESTKKNRKELIWNIIKSNLDKIEQPDELYFINELILTENGKINRKESFNKATRTEK